MNFPFSSEIREKIDRYNQLAANAEIDDNGVIVFTDEMRILISQLTPYVMSPEYDAYFIAKFNEMNISLTITNK